MPSTIDLNLPVSIESMANSTTSDLRSPSPSSSQSPPSHDNSQSNKKRNSQSAAVDENGNPKPVKRRAAKACAACRARKVRCDVMQRYHVTAEGEVTCSNCTMDGIKCVIEESKRRKKTLPEGELPILNGKPTPSQQNGVTTSQQQNWGNGVVNPSDITNPEARRWSGSPMSNEMVDDLRNQNRHTLYPNLNRNNSIHRHSFSQIPIDTTDPTYTLLTSASMMGDLTSSAHLNSSIPPPPLLKHRLPTYLRPLPPRMTSVDIDYLFAKGALSLPETSVRNALLKAYIEYVHPYMPLIEIHELLGMINDSTGQSGKVSLLLFQAIMFAGTAFVDKEFLRKAGYSNRKAARKAFFQKARVLYDFDYEMDRVSLVQSLLLMTYWYETPDDQKDTWHWQGVAISLAHTIGLHRNPANSSMSPSKKKLWKRIWWSCFMRDRLVALGMRRPTRIKDEDYDVPMLTEDDFEIQALDENNTVIGKDCAIIHNTSMQRELAQMCIAKAKLCLCISHVLSAQYSVLVKHQGMQGQEGSTRSSVMLFPKKLDQTDEVQRCDVELSDWISSLPQPCLYDNTTESGPVFVQRALLHMVYYTTLSALHRPQVLPSVSANPSPSATLHDVSRIKVREASRQITTISTDLHTRNLERFLPTTGVTVLLPAIIIHLLDLKSPSEEERKAAMDGFKRCMIVLEGLRGNYSSADFATQFLEAAVRKAGIEVSELGSAGGSQRSAKEQQYAMSAMARQRANTPPLTVEDEGSAYMHERGHMGEALGDHHPLSHITVTSTTAAAAASAVHTPPENDLDISIPITQALNASSTSNSNHLSFMTPHPSFEESLDTATEAAAATPQVDYSTFNLNDFLNFDASNTNEMWTVPLEEGAHGESGGFMGDMGLGWMDGLPTGWSRVGSPVLEFNDAVVV